MRTNCLHGTERLAEGLWLASNASSKASPNLSAEHNPNLRLVRSQRVREASARCILYKGVSTRS